MVSPVDDAFITRLSFNDYFFLRNTSPELRPPSCFSSVTNKQNYTNKSSFSISLSYKLHRSVVLAWQKDEEEDEAQGIFLRHP